jgi:uncharacterized protein YjbI with pentapeptide repeats
MLLLAQNHIVLISVVMLSLLLGGCSDPIQSIKEDNQCIDCDLEGVDFSTIELIDVDLSGSNLENANFSDANLVSVNFTNTKLGGTNFQNATITDAKFAGEGDLNLKDVATLNNSEISGFNTLKFENMGKLSNLNISNIHTLLGEGAEISNVSISGEAELKLSGMKSIGNLKVSGFSTLKLVNIDSLTSLELLDVQTIAAENSTIKIGNLSLSGGGELKVSGITSISNTKLSGFTLLRLVDIGEISNLDVSDIQSVLVEDSAALSLTVDDIDKLRISGIDTVRIDLKDNLNTLSISDANEVYLQGRSYEIDDITFENVNDYKGWLKKGGRISRMSVSGNRGFGLGFFGAKTVGQLLLSDFDHPVILDGVDIDSLESTGVDFEKCWNVTVNSGKIQSIKSFGDCKELKQFGETDDEKIANSLDANDLWNKVSSSFKKFQSQYEIEEAKILLRDVYNLSADYAGIRRSNSVYEIRPLRELVQKSSNLEIDVAGVSESAGVFLNVWNNAEGGSGFRAIEIAAKEYESGARDDAGFHLCKKPVELSLKFDRVKNQPKELIKLKKVYDDLDSIATQYSSYKRCIEIANEVYSEKSSTLVNALIELITVSSQREYEKEKAREVERLVREKSFKQKLKNRDFGEWQKEFNSACVREGERHLVCNGISSCYIQKEYPTVFYENVRNVTDTLKIAGFLGENIGIEAAIILKRISRGMECE